MAETSNLIITEEDAAQLQKLLADFLKKIKELRQQMEDDHLEISRYGAETQAIIDRLERKAA